MIANTVMSCTRIFMMLTTVFMVFNLVQLTNGWLALPSWRIYRNWPHSSRKKDWNMKSNIRLSPTLTRKGRPFIDLHVATSGSLSSRDGKDDNVLRELFPPLPLRYNGTLPVDDIHTLYFRIYGDRGPLKALFLHGGPGAGCFPNHARFFDPKHYQVVLLDQRGCGQSTPTACLINQTLSHIIDDCETLRTHLGLSHWDVILGGSWGTTVAMAYAQKYPTSMRSVVLRGVCSLRNQEIDWLFASTGIAKQNPQVWEKFAKAVDVDPSDVQYPREVLHEYYQRLVLSQNDTERAASARAWMQWEFYHSVSYQIPSGTNISDPNATMQALESWKSTRRPAISPVAVHSRGVWSYQNANGHVLPSDQLPADVSTDHSTIQARFRRGLESDPETEVPRQPWPFPDQPRWETNSSRLPVQTMLTCFYSTNDDFCRDNQNLLHRAFPTDVTCIAIQGGSDAICPPDTALDVLSKWPNMELRMPLHAGHSMYDPYITSEIVTTTDRLADMLCAKVE